MKKINDLIAWLYILGTIVMGFVLLLLASGWLGKEDYLETVIRGSAGETGWDNNRVYNDNIGIDIFENASQCRDQG